jgi:hypothetical protein
LIVTASALLTGLLIAYAWNGSDRVAALLAAAVGAAIGASITVEAADRRAREEREEAERRRHQEKEDAVQYLLEEVATDLTLVNANLSVVYDGMRKGFGAPEHTALFDLNETLEERRDLMSRVRALRDLTTFMEVGHALLSAKRVVNHLCKLAPSQLTNFSPQDVEAVHMAEQKIGEHLKRFPHIFTEPSRARTK